jgi:flagellar hook assembly protein FlgD
VTNVAENVIAVPVAALSVCPNPASHQATIRLSLPAEGRVATRIYDVSGRQVRALPEEILTTGAHDLTWDGRDDAGREVAPGVYLARLSTPEGTRTARVVIMR